MPVWFEGRQLPPSLSGKGKHRTATETPKYQQTADSEKSGYVNLRQRKKARMERNTGPVKFTFSQVAEVEDKMYDGGMEEIKGVWAEDQESRNCFSYDHETAWEVSDFSSNDESPDEWLP